MSLYLSYSGGTIIANNVTSSDAGTTITINSTANGFTADMYGDYTIADDSNISSLSTLGNKCVTTLVTNMRRLFRNNTSFNEDIGKWDTRNVIIMAGLFDSASSFNQDISNWNTSNVNNMAYMFNNASNFNQSINTNGNAWNVSNVTRMNNMFYSTPFNQNISNWDTSKVIAMNAMFYSTPFNQNISNWDTSKVTAMNGMFYSTPFNQNISNWDTSKVNHMGGMFYNATSFNQSINTNGNAWNVSNVTLMTGMFYNTPFNQDISDWDTSKVIAMNNMFNNTPFNQDITGWDFSNVTTMDIMLKNSTNFYQSVRLFNVNASILTTAREFINGATLMMRSETQGTYSGYIDASGTVTNISAYFDGSTSTAGDPHIYPIYGEPYELPKQENIYRLLQGDNLLLNASTKELSLSEQNEIYDYIDVICKNKQISDDKKEELKDQVIVDGCFYNKIYLNSDNHRLVFDFKKSTLNMFNHESIKYFTVKENKKYNKSVRTKYEYSDEIKQIIISFNNKKYGLVNLELNYFSNPQLKYGIRLNMKNYRDKELTGLLMREYKIDTMTINELQYEEPCNGIKGKNMSYSKNVLIN
jgi:surface protein